MITRRGKRERAGILRKVLQGKIFILCSRIDESTWQDPLAPPLALFSLAASYLNAAKLLCANYFLMNFSKISDMALNAVAIGARNSAGVFSNSLHRQLFGG